MSEDIKESLEAYFPNIEIEVEYIYIRKYKIKLLKKVSKHNIIKKSIIFEYNWNNNWTFSSNIEQIKYSINKYFKLYLESEVNNDNN